MTTRETELLAANAALEKELSEVRKAERERSAVVAGWQADGESAAREIRAMGDE